MRAELQDWYRFIRSNSHLLKIVPYQLFQYAANQPNKLSIAKNAAQRLQTNRETRPWLRWINKPQEPNPCLVTLESGGRKSGFAFSPDSARIVTGWNDESMRVWNAQTGQLLLRLPCLTTPKYERDLTVLGCAFVDGGKKILTYVEDDSLKLWHAETGEEFAWLARHGDGAKAWCASPDGRRVAAWFWGNNDVKIWNTATGELLNTLHSTTELTTGPMTFSPDNLLLGRASVVGTTEIWTAAYGALFSTLSLGFLDNFEFSPDETSLVTIDNVSHAAHLWHAFTGELLADFKGHKNRITACHFSPDGSRIVTSSWDNRLKLWSVEGLELKTFLGHEGQVSDCAFSPNGKLIVSASNDRTVKLWDCETGDVLATFIGHEYEVRACAFSPDGKLIVSTSNDSTRIWDAFARTGGGRPSRERSEFAFSADGSKALVGESGSLTIIDVKNGCSVRITPEQDSWVSPEIGQRRLMAEERMEAILTASGSLALVDASTRELICEFQQDEKIVQILVSPTENVFLAAGGLGSIYLLRLEMFKRATPYES